MSFGTYISVSVYTSAGYISWSRITESLHVLYSALVGNCQTIFHIILNSIKFYIKFLVAPLLYKSFSCSTLSTTGILARLVSVCGIVFVQLLHHI